MQENSWSDLPYWNTLCVTYLAGLEQTNFFDIYSTYPKQFVVYLSSFPCELLTLGCWTGELVARELPWKIPVNSGMVFVWYLTLIWCGSVRNMALIKRVGYTMAKVLIAKWEVMELHSAAWRCCNTVSQGLPMKLYTSALLVPKATAVRFVGCATVTLHCLSAVHRVQTVHTALGLCVLP